MGHRHYSITSSGAWVYSRVNTNFQRPLWANCMLPVSTTKLFDELRYVSEKEQSHEITPTVRESTLAGGILTPTFLDSFWQSYHSSLLILDEVIF